MNALTKPHGSCRGPSGSDMHTKKFEDSNITTVADFLFFVCLFAFTKGVQTKGVQTSGTHGGAGHLSVLEPAGRNAGHTPHQAGIPGELRSGHSARAQQQRLSMLGCPGVFVPALHVTHR
jgi:hypothetical protein